ncbi:MAG: hypothetical protein GY758_17495 [Fuerstiella sp.]|nr:hypothetical protein [Fuerstiella sp.]MCP4513121.1 hypothetical protein [Fuerstiella sp.]
MFRLSLILLTTTLTSASMAQEVPEGGPQLDAVWSVSAGLKAPESAYHDPATGFLFLSQIGEGGGKGKDGDGWISKLTIDGKMVKNKWVTGLNAPKGIRSHQGILYVSDIDQIVAINIAGANIAKVIGVNNAVFLNDLATDSEGTVYVSDLAASRIYQYKNDKVSVFAEGEQLEHPNGVLVDGDSLVIGGWGTGFSQEDFSTKVPGRLQKINLRTKEITAITPQPVGHLDGIETDGKGGYIVTDWRNGKLFGISKKGKARLLMNFPQGVADHAYLVDKQLIILPEMMEGKLTAFRYAPGKKKLSAN